MARNSPVREIEAGDFYVGYLKLPQRLAGFLRGCVTCVLALMMALAWTLSGSQNDPGPGVWHDDVRSLVGRISVTPYPLIRVLSDHAGQPIQTVLLVSEGKHGGGERVAALDGRIARVHGTVLERDSVRLLELAEGNAVVADDSLPPAALARLAESAERVTRGEPARITLRGEIIDPKCYSGAMKPGEGKAHKECATLCIAGGIPPMFVTIDQAETRSYYLLADAAGRALTGRVLQERVLPFVADAVELTGELEVRDDLAVLRLDVETIRRL